MQHSILVWLALAYCVCSGGIALAGLGAIAILYFRPSPPAPEVAVKLIQLGPDATGIRSERLTVDPQQLREG